MTMRSSQFSQRAILLILFSALFFPILLWAQEVPEFSVYPMSGPEGMLLIVQGKPLHPSTASQSNGWVGYHIYRRGESDTGFIRITPKPLSRVGSLAELETYASGPIDGLERLVGLNSKEELWQRLSSGDSSVMILGVFSRQFFEAMGLLLWDRQVEKTKAYSYRITRVDRTGHESPPSEAVEAVFGQQPFQLLGPLDLQAVCTRRGVELTWTRNPDDSGGMSYSVYRTPDLDGTFLRLNRHALILTPDSASGEPRGSYIDTTASQGRTFYYTVVSTDYAGNESPRDKIISIHASDLIPPAIPQNVFADPHEVGITITWEKVSDAAIGGYFIYRSLDPDSNYVRITESLLPYDTGWYVDHTATSSDRIFYRVSAVDQSGNESPLSARALSLYEDYVVPLPPQGVRLTRSDAGIKVSWSRSEESDLQGYYLFRADSYGGELTQISPLLAPDSVTYVDTSKYLSPRGEYWYLLQAVNHTGIASQFSVPLGLSPGGGEQPEQVSAFWGYYDNHLARLFWRAPDDNMISGYRIYRSTDIDSSNWDLLTPQPLDRQVTEFADSTVKPNQQYRYRIGSSNSHGDEGGRSHIVAFATFEAVAPAPGGLCATGGVTGPLLKWNATSLKDIAGYRVYRRVEGNPVELLNPRILPVTTEQYSDNTAKPGNKYYYSLSTVDTWNRESDRSTEVEFLAR